MLAGRRRPAGTPTTRARTTGTPSRCGTTPATRGGRGTIVRGGDGLVSARSASSGRRQPADDGVPEAEVGYGLVAEARGWGVATEALTALLAETDRPASGSAPACCPTTRASIRVLAKCGFTELRGANEDGELVMARPLP